MKRFPILAAAVCLLAAPDLAAANDVAVTLSGSRASMLRQNGIARAETFTFLRTSADIRNYVEQGNLVPLPGSETYRVIAGHPYARPVVRAFIERLSSNYFDACGEPLVVTSLTRPSTRQPRNASPLSVHPAGMAVDLRVSQRSQCRTWLMRELLQLEEAGVLDATLERNPPHFHVAVFPSPYHAYELGVVADSVMGEATRLLEEAVAARDSLQLVTALHVTEPEAPRAPVLLRIGAWIARLVLPVPA